MSELTLMKGAADSLLLATDLSARSDRALDRAAMQTKHWQSHLTVLHVLEYQPPFDTGEPLPSLKRPPDPVITVSKTIIESLGEIAKSATVLVQEGSVVESIMSVVNRDAIDLIVIGVARNTFLGEVMLGRTIDGLLRRSTVPVLVVKNRTRKPYGHVVVATDFSESSQQALITAMCIFPEQALTVFHAFDPPMSGLMGDAASYRQEYRKIAEQDCNAFLRETAKSKERARPFKILLECGMPSPLLQDYVINNSADLVVVGSHGRSAILDIFVGSMAKRILHEVPCDILMVGPGMYPSEALKGGEQT